MSTRWEGIRLQATDISILREPLQPASAAEIPRFNVMHMFGQYSRRATMCRATQSNCRLFFEAGQALQSLNREIISD